MNSRQAQIAIHVTAVLFGLTGIFGELIQASATLITAGRATFGALALALFVLHGGHALRKPSRQSAGLVLLAGGLLATHWATFFVAVKEGGVAIATLGFASFPAFITVLEGTLFSERTPAREWLVVGIVTAGLILITPSFDAHNPSTTALLWAIASGLAFALFTLSNRKAAGQLPARQLACWQALIVAALTLPWSAPEFFSLRAIDWLWVALLGIFCTALSQALLVSSLSQLKARSAGIVLALEPVYAIVFAAILFGQYPTARMALGGILILAAIVWSGLRPRPARARAPESRPNR